MKLITTTILILFAIQANAQSVLGKWKTVDDETGEVKSVVHIYERGDKVYGKIIKLFRDPDQNPDPICDDCPEDDPRYNKKIIGMEIIKDLEKEGDEYVGGTVLKPDEGKIYKCKIWLNDEGKLNIRGYWGWFYRTQTWIKTE